VTGVVAHSKALRATYSVRNDIHFFRRTRTLKNVTIIGPVFPYRAGIAYCTTRLAEELDADIVSFSRQFPRAFYPGGSDIDESLEAKTPPGARFMLDIVNPRTWIRTALHLRRKAPDAVIFVWWVWVWALPYLTLLAFLPGRTKVILQCHNIGDKEPALWKRFLTNRVLKRGQFLVVHARSEAEDAARRLGRTDATIVQTFLPVHELGGEIPSREEARRELKIAGNTALFFGHVRPFKGLDIAIEAWRLLKSDATLLVAGEAWWKGEEAYRKLAEGLPNVRFDFRFIPDSEIATYFAAADVVLAPYRIEAQSGVALTSFHFARPIIATEVGGLPEIVEQGVNGVLVPAENPAALAGAIDTFFSQSDRPRMERAAAASALRYSWEEYGRVFRGLVAANARPVEGSDHTRGQPPSRIG
jgi:glycosyltransferase involved in cell wall biosynthesis